MPILQKISNFFKNLWFCKPLDVIQRQLPNMIWFGQWEVDQVVPTIPQNMTYLTQILVPRSVILLWIKKLTRIHRTSDIRYQYLLFEPSLNPFGPKLTELLASKSPHLIIPHITTTRVLVAPKIPTERKIICKL